MQKIQPKQQKLAAAAAAAAVPGAGVGEDAQQLTITSMLKRKASTSACMHPHAMCYENAAMRLKLIQT